MCKNQPHDRKFGKEAIMALVEAQFNPKDICNARMKYLTNQVENFRSWLKEQGSDNPDMVIESIERDTWTTLKSGTDDEFIWSRGERYDNEGEISNDEAQLSLSNINAGKDNPHIRMLEQEDADFFEAYNMDQTAIRGLNQKEDTPSDVEQTWIDWLSKVDAVYHDSSIVKECYLPKPVWSKCRRAVQGLNNCRKSKMLDWNTWALLSNWNFRLLGWNKRYDIQDTQDPVENFSDADIVDVWYTRD